MERIRKRDSFMRIKYNGYLPWKARSLVSRDLFPRFLSYFENMVQVDVSGSGTWTSPGGGGGRSTRLASGTRNGRQRTRRSATAATTSGPTSTTTWSSSSTAPKPASRPRSWTATSRPCRSFYRLHVRTGFQRQLTAEFGVSSYRICTEFVPSS